MDISKLDKLRKEVDEQQVKASEATKLSREDALIEAEYIVKKAMSEYQPQEGANPMKDLSEIFGKGFTYLKSMGYGGVDVKDQFMIKVKSDLEKKVK